MSVMLDIIIMYVLRTFACPGMTTTLLPQFACENNILVVCVHVRLALNGILKYSLKKEDLIAN